MPFRVRAIPYFMVLFQKWSHLENKQLKGEEKLKAGLNNICVSAQVKYSEIVELRKELFLYFLQWIHEMIVLGPLQTAILVLHQIR